MRHDEGPVYTKGTSYRARAEARQRSVRATLGVPCARYGHLLMPDDAAEGRNFVSTEAFAAARRRRDAGKGVAQRTFDNMLSSQAMAFNIFAPLCGRLELAARTLGPFVPGLASVRSITIEHTPAADVFGDQTGLGGVDCDLLLEGKNDRGEKLVCVIETKFVEAEFSVCGFRSPDAKRRGWTFVPTTFLSKPHMRPASTRRRRAMRIGGAVTSMASSRTTRFLSSAVRSPVRTGSCG